MKEWIMIGERIAALPTTSPADRALIKAHIRIEDAHVPDNALGENGDNFIQSLRQRRVNAGMSVRALARGANLSPAYISKLERGIAGNPSRKAVEAIQIFLGHQGAFTTQPGLGDSVISEGLNVILEGHRLNQAEPAFEIGQSLAESGVKIVQSGAQLMHQEGPRSTELTQAGVKLVQEGSKLITSQTS